MSIEKYLAGNCYSEIKVGQSGADVYNINGDMILKHVERKKLEANLFDTYAREACVCAGDSFVCSESAYLSL